MFEVSNAVADAMHRWRAESGDPFLCVDCATHIAWGDAILAMDGECTDTLDEIPVGGNSDSRLLTAIKNEKGRGWTSPVTKPEGINFGFALLF